MLPLAVVLAAGLTEPQIAEAIAYGATTKDRTISVAIIGGGMGRARGVELCGIATTPFMRVATRAQKAKNEYRKFERSDVTATDLDPVLVVYGSRLGRTIHAKDVAAIVVMPKGAKTNDLAILPLKSEPREVKLTNSFGASGVATEMVATFPLDVLQDGNEIRIAYVGGAECSLKIKAKDWR